MGRSTLIEPQYRLSAASPSLLRRNGLSATIRQPLGIGMSIGQGAAVFSKHQKCSGEFYLNSSDGVMKLVARDRSGFVFDMWYKDEKYAYVDSRSIISFNRTNTFLGETHSIQYQHNGYGIMVYSDGDFVGRIKKHAKWLFTRVQYSIHFIDYSAVSFLMALCTIELMQYHVYKTHESGG
ncbi:MAG: hypothetical protein EAY75_07510 [Bacteroidetes bacterium]|nr:MAG: hypothetical protein EAY75_07510 [Bacteroidota bacterium]